MSRKTADMKPDTDEATQLLPAGDWHAMGHQGDGCCAVVILKAIDETSDEAR